MDHLDSSDEINDELSRAMSPTLGEPDYPKPDILEKIEAMFVDKTGPLSYESKNSTGKWHSQDLSEYSNSNIWIPETFEI